MKHYRVAASWCAALFVVTSAIGSAASPDLQKVNTAFEQIRNNPILLHDFVKRMPKGGDLHVHLTGAVYAESLIREAAEDHLCIDRPSLTIETACRPGSSAASEALKDQALYDSLVDSFSMRNFVPSAGVSGHDHFFATFDRFDKVSGSRHMGEWLDEIASRAAEQNEQYLEIMHTLDFAEAARLGRAIGWNNNLPAIREALLAGGLKENVEQDRQAIEKGEGERLRLEHCETAEKAPACGVKIRILFQVLRGFPPEQVFAQALLGFELASVDPHVVGINLVMPEDGVVSMAEYHRQMQMLDYLHSVYPSVHLSLHAGELSPGLVPEEGLAFHIREAVELAHAERIGHGVDIMYERQPQQLLREMAARHVLVEINLTSNDVILGIKGRNHPLPVYLDAHVPVALATDDEGVSRIDLTHEYQRAVEEFGFSYGVLKEMVWNSIVHSFLPAEEKSEELRQLQTRFDTFESGF